MPSSMVAMMPTSTQRNTGAPDCVRALSECGFPGIGVLMVSNISFGGELAIMEKLVFHRRREVGRRFSLGCNESSILTQV